MQPTDPSQIASSGLRDYWKVLARRKWIFLSFFVIAVTSVVLGTFLMTPVYQATTNILIEGENTNVLRAEEAPSGTSFDIYENYLQTQMALIESRGVAGKVAEEFKLEESPRYAKKEGVRSFLERKFIDDIELTRLPGTRMVALSIFNPDPELAAKLANRLAEAYAQDNLNRRALTFIRNQRMASLNAEFLRLQAKLDAMSTQIGPLHPDMIALRNEIGSMAKRIQNEENSQGRPQDAGTAVRTGEQALLEETLLKIQESSVISSSRMNNIVIVDKANVPKKIAKPNRALNLTVGLLVGLLGGLLLAFLADYLDDSIRSYEDLKRFMGSTDYLGSVFSERGGRSHTKGLDKLMALRSESPSAEAYRLVRTAIVWHIRKENKIKDIAILSAGPGEGKTTIASNLAIALAQLNLKVLLVDSDIRRGRLHDTYDPEKKQGLGHYLTDGLALDQVLNTTDVPGLSLVPCGSSVINSSQLYSSPRMTEFIQESRKRFDIVLYDTAPLAIISDTSILMSQLSGSVLAVRSGITKAGALAKSLALIRDSKTAFIGVMLNSQSSGDEPYYNKYYSRKKN